jgi:chitin synthase
LESVIGYITVLPGAFSAYKWEALDGPPLWEEYFKSLSEPHKLDCFTSNVYLAEDRVLCLHLIASPKQKYNLRYVKKSQAVTDVPEKF